jgi:2-polyprenyl-6-methoxyphenol hydroxylase-like FAD-dependent oxidoreductase
MKHQDQLHRTDPRCTTAVIAGAGPVGLSLALGLARHGVESIILEKNNALEQYSRAILVPTRTLDIFEEWGILDLAMRAGTYSPCLQVYGAESGKVAMTIDFTDLKDLSENAGFLFLPQDRTEAILLDAVRSTGLCEVHFGTTVSRFSQDGQGVTIEAIKGKVNVKFQAQYLIGCDGGHSIVRQHLGLQLAGKTYKARVLIADVKLLSGTELPTPRIALNAKGPLVMLRFGDERWRIVGTSNPLETEEQAQSKEGVAARVRMLAGDLPFDLLWASTFHIHHRAVSRLRVNHVFLAGDAAHLSSPAGGMGMNSGIEDAHNLAWKIAAVLSPGSTSLLDSYETERLYAVIHAVERTSDIASNTLYFAPFRMRVLFMALFGAAMKLRPLRRRILTAMTMLSTRYPASEFITGDRRWAGRIAPDCEIKTGEASVRLFSGRRGKHLLVCYGIRPPSGCGLETIEISIGNGADFRRTWGVNEPFSAIVRPDGFIGWAKENVSQRDIESTVSETLVRSFPQRNSKATTGSE